MKAFPPFSFKARHKFILIIGAFYWDAFYGGAWLTYHFGTTYKHEHGLEDYQALHPVLFLWEVIALLVLPIKWPRVMVLPVTLGAFVAVDAVMGSYWWEDYWAARALPYEVGPEHTFWIWSFYSSFFIHIPILVAVYCTYMSIRQMLHWTGQAITKLQNHD
jgi:hypothetical protein